MAKYYYTLMMDVNAQVILKPVAQQAGEALPCPIPDRRPNVQESYEAPLSTSQIEEKFLTGRLADIIRMNPRKMMLICADETSGYQAWVVDKASS